MNQIVALQILFGSLIIGILFIILIFIGYSADWLILRFSKKRNATKSEEWLEVETKDVLPDESQAPQMSIMTSMKSASRRRKIFAVTLIFMLFFMFIWLSWELSSNGYVDSKVYNTDTRVFSEAYVEDNATSLYVMGSHDLTLDTRRCVLESYSIPFSSQTHCYPNITARWNLTCKISATILGYTSVEILHILRTDDGISIFDALVFNLTAFGNENEFNKIQEKSAISDYRCLSTHEYLISIILRVTLSGISSVEGLEPGTPLSLLVENISVSNGS